MGSCASTGAGPAAVESPPPVTSKSPATAAVAQAPSGASNGTCKFMIVENEHIKIGVDPSRGAGICYLAKGGTNNNVLNEFDCGRFVQQSYYGKEDGSDWNGKPWRWNPVQCGSWQNRPARVNSCHCDKPGLIVTEVNPRNWAGQELLENVTMRAEITVEGKHAHVKFTMRYSGSDMHEVRIQELPAVFLTRRLSELVFYDGPNPWQGQALQRKKPSFPNENYRITENWAAYIDPSTGEGVGIYTPVAQTLTCYRVGEDSSCACSDCSYLAPTMRFSVKPGAEYVYHTFIMMGTVEQMRQEFSGIRGWALNNRPDLLQCEAMADATPAI